VVKKQEMMNAREEILAAVRKNKPEPAPLPEIPFFDRPDLDNEAEFERMTAQMGGSFVRLNSRALLAALIAERYSSMTKIISNVGGYAGIIAPEAIINALDLEDVELAVLEGEIAVAENAAVWISEKKLISRALPFICEHLVLVFNSKQLVYNMHQAYAALKTATDGYGVFIAGPSKTADIEQSLVIGAHGPKSLLAVMLSDD
jgi:L-lactate dehydrogenase complex protein LldG